MLWFPAFQKSVYNYPSDVRFHGKVGVVRRPSLKLKRFVCCSWNLTFCVLNVASSLYCWNLLLGCFFLSLVFCIHVHWTNSGVFLKTINLTFQVFFQRFLVKCVIHWQLITCLFSWHRLSMKGKENTKMKYVSSKRKRPSNTEH